MTSPITARDRSPLNRNVSATVEWDSKGALIFIMTLCPDVFRVELERNTKISPWILLSARATSSPHHTMAGRSMD